MQETRRRILELLRVHGGQTVRELGAALGLTRTAVTSHLAALAAEGAVVRGSLRHGKRRPSLVYQATGRTGAAFPEGYEEFSLARLPPGPPPIAPRPAAGRVRPSARPRVSARR